MTTPNQPASSKTRIIDDILSWLLSLLPPKYKTAVGVLGECLTLAAYRLGYLGDEWAIPLGMAFAALIGVGASGKAQRINTKLESELAAVRDEMKALTDNRTH